MASSIPDPGADTHLSIVNHPASRITGPSLLHQLVRTSSSDEDTPAIDFLSADGDRVSLSYRQLHDASDALASRIWDAGGFDQAETKQLIVPVLLPQGPELYVALLAILKIGAAFCPLNLDVPIDRARFILGDLSARVVVTNSEFASRIPENLDGVVVVLLVDSKDDVATTTQTSWRTPQQPTDLAYVMYTSGSTGTPKGVGVSHDAATQSLLAHDRHIPRFSRFLQFAAPTFDVSVFEIFFPFFRGTTLVSCTRAAMLNDLPAVMREMDIDACELTPTVAGSLLRRRDNAPALKLLLTIGEMLTTPVVEEFGGSEGRESILWAMYGPTEAAIHCTLQPAFTKGSTIGNIGVPLDTVSAFIVEILEESDGSETGEIKVIPRGEIGELVVGGYQVADGYINRPEMTAKAFIDSQYGRLYRTGDKARMRRDGTLECLGRISDGQVKLRGQRIELGEIEHAALRTPGCHSAFAAIINNILVLFCAVDQLDGMNVAITQSCNEWLPGFMVPGDIVVLDEFPRLPSGKVDRKALVADYSNARAQEKQTEPVFEDELDRELCRLAQQILGAEIDPGKNLSRAGMDSLLAIKFASTLRKAGISVGVVDILGSKTISALASRIKRSGSTLPLDNQLEEIGLLNLKAASNIPVLQGLENHIEFMAPCTPLQTSMLTETQANPIAYCNWVELSFPAELAETIIQSWFHEAAQKNESLRTGFVHDGDQFVQIIFKELDPSEVLVTDHVPVKEFDMSTERDFLRPFRVQIVSGPTDQDKTARLVLLQLHHAVYDGWSMDMILADLGSLAEGQTIAARPPFRQVSAYYGSDLFQRHCDTARAFWAESLVGYQPTSLPILNPELPSSSTVRSACVPLDIQPSTVRAALHELDAGPQTIFQAAVIWLWGALIGTDDVVVGSVISGRTVPVPQIEDVIGPCIAATPLRTNLSQVRTVRDLLVTLHAANRNLIPHSILPLVEIKRAAGLCSGQSIYDLLFVYQESLHSRSRAGASRSIIQVSHQDFLETKLLVEVEPSHDNFVCRFTYHTSCFPESQISVLGEAIQTLVPYMLNNLDVELGTVQRAFPQNLLSVYNAHPKTFSGLADLALAVEVTAARFPTKNALCFADRISDDSTTTTTLSFAGLNKTANQIARCLGERGVRDGEVVAIVMEKSVLLYAGILAILKAGCTYLPLLPSTPVARVDTIFRQAKVGVCLVDTATQQLFGTQLSCSLLDIQATTLDGYSACNLSLTPNPERIAYIIYTSGSTGVPKGVCVTQRNIISNLDVLSRIYPVKDRSRLLQSCSQAFDVSVFEIFFAWTQGMCLCSATNDTLFEDLERSIRNLGVTHLSMTPTVASLVDRTSVPDVEFLVTSGEAMTEIVAQKWAKQLYQGYGPSETTNICSVKKMDTNQNIHHLGWSFENTSTFVMFRDSMEVAPLGTLGELCFGGDQIAQGYLAMPDLTSSKFVEHSEFGRLYRSGDLGRMLPDGSMVITGRIDDQIKIRGQRVELGEINHIVGESEAVVDCATLFCPPGQIITYYVPKSGTNPESGFYHLEIDDSMRLEIQTLFRTLVAKLPAYMVPSLVIPVSTLPVTASGKLDRARLRQTAAQLGQDYLSLASHAVEVTEDGGQWSTVESELADIVSTTFGVDRRTIRRWTPLTTIGLDSISAIRLSKRILDKMGKRVAISTVLQNASVARLAQELPHTVTGATAPDRAIEFLPAELIDAIATSLTAKGRNVEKVLPCTPLQEAMLAASVGRGSYLNRMLFRINDDLFPKIKAAWTAMCERHGILRTCFVSTQDSRWPIVQLVLDKSQQPQWLDFDTSSSTSTTVEQCLSRHGSTLPDAIDSMEPVVSFGIITQNGDTFLSFICHHALYDGVAMERLLFEVEQLVGGLELAPPPLYDEFLHMALQPQEGEKAFWSEHLAKYKPKMVAGRFKLENGGFCPSSAKRDIETPLSEIKDMANQVGISLLSLCQSAWAVTIGCLSDVDDICFGNVVSGRSLASDGIDQLVAPCFNTIPVRINLSDHPRNVDVMKTFQNINPVIIQHQFTPLRRIQSSLFSDSDMHNRRRLFDTLLLLQHSPRLLDEAIWTLVGDDGEMDVPLVCELIPDTIKDLFTIKLHLEQRSFPVQIPGIILDLFSYVFRSLLRYPSSHRPSLDTIHVDIRERLIRLPIEQLEHLGTEDGAPRVETTDTWRVQELQIRDVLSALSSSPRHAIQRQTTIYQLGMDSIVAVQIASMLRKQGLYVSASDVIGNPTCATLAQFVESQASSSANKETVYDMAAFRVQVQVQIEAHGVEVSSTEEILPCTPLLAGMMSQFMQSSGGDYFNFIDFRVDESVSATTLAGAWRSLYLAHPILRTRLIPVEHKECNFALVQCVPDAFPLPLIIHYKDQAGTFNLQKWRLDSVHSAVMKPDEKLWRTAIVETEDGSGMMMHVAIHHCLYDARSLQLLLSDLAKLAQGHPVIPSRGIKRAVAEIFGQISDSTRRGKEFWKSQADKVVVNRFPVMTPLRELSRRVMVESLTSGMSFGDLEHALAESGYTLQVVLQAAWTRVLSSYLGEPSVVFGVVLSGRNTEATQDAVFPCFTTLPVISNNTSSNETLLRQMLAYNTELHKQHHQPLTRIQQWLGLPGTRLFDTLLVYQKFDVDITETTPWSIINEQVMVDFPVSVEAEPRHGDRLGYQITFFSDVLPKEQAKILLEQFDAMVCHLAFEPAGDENGLSVSVPELFSIIPAQQPELPSPVQLLHQFVELQALTAPHRIALHFVDGFEGGKPVGREWTYGQLNMNGNRVAQMVVPHTKTGDIVAVYFDKSPEALFSILGVLKAGCTFVALDPGAPPSRKKFIVEDSGASLVLTSKERERALGFEVLVPVLSVDEDSLADFSSHPPATTRKIKPNDVCYCLYTSGTTGLPKGCEITHNNAVQCMLAFQDIFDGHWDANSRWLQFASLHFDVSVLEQYWTWSVGITLVGAPRDLILEDLAGTINKLDITHIDLTPSLARLVHPDDVPSLCRGVFITGGESLKQEILDVWGSKAVIYNFYGPTEATIGVTVYPRVPQNGRSSNIGKQFINVGAYVLKPGTEEPVLRGAVGELCVSGKLVGKGYLKRHDLTRERFPTLRKFGERVYRTGDLVRVLHDDCFDFLGRADDQVKLRGQRLEIGEINHAMKTDVDKINDVATIVVRNEKQQKDFLVSFVVAGTEKKGGGLCIIKGAEAQRLCQLARLACQSKLPGYMVPTYFFQLPFIPLSPNNKAEIKVLKGLFQTFTEEDLVPMASENGSSGQQLTDTVTRIAKVLAAMQQSFNVDSLSLSSNIFEVGIDSISVFRFSRNLKREGFEQASPSVILGNPVLRDLCQVLGSQNAKASATGSSVAAAHQTVHACGHRHRTHVCRDLGVTSDQIEYISPCTPLQLGMISGSANSKVGAYFNTFRFGLARGVDVARLCQAWQLAVDKFEILRTVFVNTVDGFVQVALKSGKVPWTDVDTRYGDSMDLEEIRRTWISDNRDNITRPLEMHCLQGGKGCHLILNIFHGIYDANSLRLILDQVVWDYGLLVVGGSSPPQTCRNSPSFLEAMCHGPLQRFDTCKDFWVQHFGTISLDSLQVSQQTESTTDLAVFVVDQEVPFEAVELLRTRLGVTHQAIVQAAWVWALSSIFSVDQTIGIVTSGRGIDLEGAEAVVGPLFNTLPFHASIRKRKGLTWSSLIRECHDFNTAVLAFQHVSLRDVQKWCSSGGRPLFDTLFVFQREEDGGSKDCALWTEVDSEQKAQYPLALEATLTEENCLRLLVVGTESKVGGDVLQTLVAELVETFVAMVEDANRTLSQKRGEEGEMLDSGYVSIGTTPREDGVNGTSEHPKFMWTEKATLVRREIACLADIPPDAVGEMTSIFELGLDSIDVIKLATRLKQHGIIIKTSELMKAQTIESIMQVLHAVLTNGHGHNGISTPPRSRFSGLKEHVIVSGLVPNMGGIKGVLPATPLQDSMMMEMIHSDFQVYFNHDVLEIGADVDTERLKAAWMTVIAGSPILRTTFVQIDSPEYDFAYCQIINSELNIHFVEVEVQDKGDLGRIVETATQRARKGGGKCDLLQLVIANAPTQRFLVLSIAHALYDGRSLSLIHHGVKAAYDGQFVPRQPYEPYLEEFVFSADKNASMFWSDFLDGATATILPERRSGPGKQHRAEAGSSHALADVKSFCRRHAITFQILGQACWAALLATKTASLDVTFGLVLSGRDSQDADELMFPTMNTVAMRSVLHGSVSSWLRYMQENAADLAPFQHFPLRKAQKLARGTNGGPLFNSLFIHQRSIKAASPDQNVLAISINGSSMAEYPVCVEMEVGDACLIWRSACDERYISREETTLLLHQLDVVLGYLITMPTAVEVLKFTGSQVSICGLAPFLPNNPGTPSPVPVDGSAIDTTRTWSAREDIIRHVLSEVSSVPVASILKTHNIYHLGLDSITAVKATSLLRKQGVVIKFRDMISAKSIEHMAELSKETDAGCGENGPQEDGHRGVLSGMASMDTTKIINEAGISMDMIEEVLPATGMQVHMLSVWQNTNGAVFYPEFRFNLTGDVSEVLLSSAWERLVEEIPILRTTFVATTSRDVPILQAILRPHVFPDLETWTSRSAQPFCRMTITKVSSSSKWTLRLQIHHALYDAISLPMIMRRFLEFCGRGTTQNPTVHTPSAWGDVVRTLTGRSGREHRKEFWTRYLSGLVQLPSSLNLKTVQYAAGHRVSLLQPNAFSQTGQLRMLCETNGVSLQALFFAAYAEHLAARAAAVKSQHKQQDVIFGVYIANRAEVDERNVLPSPTLCLVPLRVKMDKRKSLIEVSAAIQEDLHMISASENVGVGLWEVKDWSGVVLDSFVNFLGASPAQRRYTVVEDGNMMVALEDVTNEDEDQALQDRGGGDDMPLRELPGNIIVRDAYPDAIDVEVLVEGDCMTIGVFGSRERLGEHGVVEMVSSITEILKGL
ncbi:non-ribosomal peptide synthetase [Apodospora peruviana]|uniref:Non-ribosomal peptide synthetase n=1 Tax=Apodospora peruviana TaxID=516989 RepID=A0AAE0I044_9PEZI|nr:non-ribosomal peptide synthetase [Apodospora peruviana]